MSTFLVAYQQFLFHCFLKKAAPPSWRWRRRRPLLRAAPLDGLHEHKGQRRNAKGMREEGKKRGERRKRKKRTIFLKFARF